LLAHGFECGRVVRREWSEGKLVLTAVLFGEWNELPRDERTTVAGTRERPIIDIATTRVAETFKGERVRVAYRQGRITITNEE
jgi:hypothetical protein